MVPGEAMSWLQNALHAVCMTNSRKDDDQDTSGQVMDTGTCLRHTCREMLTGEKHMQPDLHACDAECAAMP